MFSLHIYIVVILCIIWIRTNCTQWEIYICLHARPTQRLVRLWLHLWIVSLNVLQGVIGLALSLSDSLSNNYETTQPECSIVCSWSEYLLQIYPILSFLKLGLKGDSMSHWLMFSICLFMCDRSSDDEVYLHWLLYWISQIKWSIWVFTCVLRCAKDDET